MPRISTNKNDSLREQALPHITQVTQMNTRESRLPPEGLS